MNILVVIDPFCEQTDYRMGGSTIEFRTMRPFQPGHALGELDHGSLHTEANSKIGNPVLSGKANSLDLSLNPSAPKPTGDQNPVHALQKRSGSFFFHVFGIHVRQIHVAIIGDSSVD